MIVKWRSKAESKNKICMIIDEIQRYVDTNEIRRYVDTNEMRRYVDTNEIRRYVDTKRNKQAVQQHQEGQWINWDTLLQKTFT